MGMDLITQLPLNWNGKSDFIVTYIDNSSGQVHLVNTDTMVTVEGVADIYYKDIFHLHGFSEKVYLNRDLQFIAWFMKALYECLEIKTSFTTMYHPQDNGKVEWMN